MYTFEINIPKEIKIWLVLFLIMNITNLGAIILYSGEWKELYTQLGFVFEITCLSYLLVSVFRFVVERIKKKMHHGK